MFSPADTSVADEVVPREEEVEEEQEQEEQEQDPQAQPRERKRHSTRVCFFFFSSRLCLFSSIFLSLVVGDGGRSFWFRFDRGQWRSS